MSRSDAEAECWAIVERLTGRPEIATEGDLSAQVVFTNSMAQVVEGDEIQDASGICSIASTDQRSLTGSVLGLGNRPIPWAA